MKVGLALIVSIIVIGVAFLYTYLDFSFERLFGLVALTSVLSSFITVLAIAPEKLEN